MIERVGDDEVFFPQNSGNRASIRREARLKNHASFNVLESSNLFFQLHVNLHGAGNCPHRSGAYAVLASGYERCLAQLAAPGQAKAIIRRQVDDLLPVECANGSLFVIEDVQLEVSDLRFEAIQLTSNGGTWI